RKSGTGDVSRSRGRDGGQDQVQELSVGASIGRVADGLKIPPHSIEAEQAVLGGLMLDNAAWEVVADQVREEDFYRNDHRLIFRAIGDLCKRNEPVDVVTVSEWLAHHKQLDEAGGFSYLAAMAG